MDSLEKLLLLEMLVDNVYYERTAIDPAFLKNLRDTNVRFQILDFPPIIVGEADFCQSTGDTFDNSEVAFKSGKSVLFALPDVNTAMRQPFDIYVTVSRKTAKNEEQEIGKTIINLGESFMNLLEATSYDGVCPTSRTVRDSYPIHNSKGIVIGYVTIFVRLSCFGKIIVTQFQADSLNDKSFCFKGGKDEAAPTGSPVVEVIDHQPSYYGGGQMPMPPCFIPPSFGGQMPMYQTMKVPAPLKKRPIVNPCGRIPSELLSTDSEGEKGQYCMHKNCPQGYPRPPWITGENRGKKRRKASGLPVGSTAFQGDDILFQMSNPLYPTASTANKQNTVFKVNQEPDQERQNVQMVEPEFKNKIDYENDIFLLTFGKHDVNNKPAKLIVTMKTPKVPILNEHKCTSDRHCQTDPSLSKTKVSPVLSPLQSAIASNLTTTEIATALGKTWNNPDRSNNVPSGQHKRSKSRDAP